jgi:hypothetical protein
MPNISLRFFNVYGPKSRTTGAYGAVFGVFLAQKLAKKVNGYNHYWSEIESRYPIPEKITNPVYSFEITSILISIINNPVLNRK